MTALLLSLLGKFWPFIVGAVGIGIAALKLRQSGAKAERAKQAAAEAKARDIADDIQNDIGAMTAEQRKAELRKWSKS